MALSDIAGGGDWYSTIDSALTGSWSFLKIGLILIIPALVGYYIWYRKQYKYSVKLKILQNKQFVYLEDIAKKIVDNGAQFWYIKGLKERAIIPPGESMYLTPGGRWVAEGYYDRSAGVFWGRDTLAVQDFQKTILQQLESGEARTADGKTTGGIINTHFQPMTSTQRSLQSNQVTKAVLRKGQNFWNILWQLTPMVFMLIIFVLVLIFWNDIAKPVLAVQGQNTEISKQNQEMQQQNLRFYTMLTGGKGNGTFIVQQLPGDEQIFPIGGPP